MSTTDRLNGVTSQTYDKNNNLLTITDSENKVTSYEYNIRNEKIKETYADHTGGNPGDAGYGIVEVAFDPAGRLQLRTDQNGDTQTLVYDMASRLLQRDYRTKANSPSGTIADSDVMTYDTASRLLTGHSSRYDNTIGRTYDNVGRVATESLTIASRTYTVSHEYDLRSMRKKTTYPNGSTWERSYTARRQLHETQWNSNVIDTRSYDDGGRLTDSAYGNGVTNHFAYRNDNLLSSISHTHPGGTATTRQVGTYSYTWDANKNKTKETISGQIPGYSFDTTLGVDPDGYDDEDRLIYYKRQSVTDPQLWSLSLVGDWTSHDSFGVVQDRTHSATHEVESVEINSTIENLQHDVKGNVTSIPANAHPFLIGLTWDFDNQLVSADVDDDQTADVTFEYDVLKRRVARTPTVGTARVYIHAGNQIIADYDRGASSTSTPAYRYVWGSYIDEPILRIQGSSTVRYYHRNQQYSTTAITNSTGLVVERYVYTAYGGLQVLSPFGGLKSWSDNSNRYTYTGREWDNTIHLYNFRARQYSPHLGRFLTRDPLGYVDGMSLYRGYFAVSGTDSSGQFEVSVHRTYCSGCGFADLEWFIDPGPGETFIVQRICYDVEIELCIRDSQHRCLDVGETMRCKTCFYERLWNYNEASAKGGRWGVIDGWRPPYINDLREISASKSTPFCGHKGRARISSEIRSFRTLPGMNEEWHEGRGTFSCGDFIIQASNYKIDRHNAFEAWWHTGVVDRKHTWMGSYWDCCGCPNDRNNERHERGQVFVSNNGELSRIQCTDRPDPRSGDERKDPLPDTR